MQFLIIHGSFVNWQYYWLSWLKTSLESQGHQVIAPDFPVDTYEYAEKHDAASLSKQSLNSWLSYFEENILGQISEKDLVVVGHSLGPLFWLHLAAKYNLSNNMGIFVAPFYQALKKNHLIEAVNHTFYKTDFDWTQVRQLIPKSYVIYSHHDPYVPEKYSIEFARNLNSQTIDFQKPTHFGRDHQTFPLILELCQTILE